MADTFPNGYANRLVSLDELHHRHAPNMHPEYERRIFSCIEAADGLVGIGNGWRSRETQAANHARAPNTFAAPGLSFHESQRWASGFEAYAAVDVVGRHARHHEAWDWMRDHAGRFGLCSFWNVNGEPWHVQFSDLPRGATAWKAAGSPDPPPFQLARSAATEARPAMTAADQYGDFPGNPTKPEIRNGWHGDLVRYLQLVISNAAGGAITVDGDFGPQSERRVKDLQFLAALPTSGVVDWNGTWQFVDYLAGYRATPAPPAAATAPSVTDVEVGYYWVQRGDSPWKVAELVYGDGSRYTALEPTDPPAPGFFAADHAIRLPGVCGRTTKVLAGDHTRALVQRLFPECDPGQLVDRFQSLNGGQHRALTAGELVFLDRPGR
jgi:peptidoglycan hydrolase-like protein with peptidoglycan-binding domain